MYYPELLEVIDKTGAKEAIEKIDKYFAFLPNRSENIITISNLANRLELDYSIIGVILKYLYELGIVDKVYIAICPECGREILISNQKELISKVKELDYCIKCRNEIFIKSEDIVVGYKVIKQPEIGSVDIAIETSKLFGSESHNFNDEDILEKMFENHKENPNDFFYDPSEVEIEKLKKAFESLDSDYGDSTTEQGKALEGLMCDLFNICDGMHATTDIRTPTNQIDCTIRNDYFIPLTVYRELGSIFKIECKNEPAKKPDNTYYHKLHSIISGNKNDKEQAIGIIASRLEPTGTCKTLAREFFLNDRIIIINICDKDLKRIIFEKANLLELLQEKIQTIKNNISTDPDKHKLYRKKSSS
ncbi:hypothetical protein [Clostridium beijerinckii]|uniref:hypothetical protein n=1 Tax=Clostridium beijerinckii TaxID=1520 RepID=UPI00047BAFC1|nr:hypothetical protein [Clostridium beijerinckii]